MTRQAEPSGLNPHYSPREDAVTAIAEHLAEDDSAYADRDEAKRQAQRIMAAMEERGLCVASPATEERRQEMAQEHTPGPDGGPEYPNWGMAHKLPWTCSLPTHEGFWIHNDSVNICLIPGFADHPGQRALAEYIVRACNSHPALVEALEEARDQVSILQDELGIEDSGSGTLSIIDAALSAAKGEG